MIVQEELEEMGKRVPEDIQIIGYDGLPVFKSGETNRIEHCAAGA